MPSLPFVKMHGAGNDFVVLDALHSPLPAAFDFSTAARHLCQPRFNIGGDGLLLLEQGDAISAANTSSAVRMRMWNPDGTEDMCGNGLRCVAWLAHRRGYTARAAFTVQTLSGPRAVRVLPGNQVRVAMGQPGFRRNEIPIHAPERDDYSTTEYSLPLFDEQMEIPHVTSLSTGTTHTVIFVDEMPPDEKFQRLSPRIEHHPWFPERTSVLWARVKDERNLSLRIWERGAGETLACGTGACAAAVAAQVTKRCGGPVAVASRGGTLLIEWQPGQEIFKTGPARVVFEGTTGYDQ